MFVMIQQDYFQKNVFIVPNIYKWGHCRQPNEVTRGQPQNLNGVSQLKLGLFFGNSEDVRPKMCLSHQHMLYGYIYMYMVVPSIITCDFTWEVVSECKEIVGTTMGTAMAKTHGKKDAMIFR
jgi:hypothetical protein